MATPVVLAVVLLCILSVTIVQSQVSLENLNLLELDEEDELSGLSALSEYGFTSPQTKDGTEIGGKAVGNVTGKEIKASPFAQYDSHNLYNPYGGADPVASAAPVKPLSLQSAPVKTAENSTDVTSLICPSHCSGEGYCGSGNCFCKQGFKGPDCAKPTCPNNCNNNGHCVQGKCRCYAGFSGFDCSYRGCQDQCSHKGYCHIGVDRSTCICFPGFKGTTCATGPSCGWGESGKSCSGNGQCVDNTCFCKKGYTGDDCSQVICPSGPPGGDDVAKSMCSGFGVCNTNTGTCECEYPHFGLACENAKCPADCAGNGVCNQFGHCECKPGFYGKDCSPKNCPDDCNGHGDCMYKVHKNGEGKTAQCICHPGYGPDSDGKSNSCSSRICEPGRVGKNCEQRVCIDKCHADKGHGKCDRTTFTCACKEGWSGVSCQFKSCPDLCNHHGTCNDGVCNCKDDWTGKACEVPPKKCPNSCSNHGSCFRGKCYCDDGWSGKDCHKASNVDFPVATPEIPYQGIVCIPACSANGQCMTIDGTNECFCKDGWSGLSCDTYVHTPGNLRSIDRGASIGPAFLGTSANLHARAKGFPNPRSVANSVEKRLSRKTKSSVQNVL